jgi:hypothetical protein
VVDFWPVWCYTVFVVINKQHRESEYKMSYVAIVAQDLKTQEIKLVIQQLSKPVINAKGMAPDQVIVGMVRDYIARDNNLDEMQMWHFLNWSVSFQNLRSNVQRKSKLNVQLFSLENEQAVADFQSRFQESVA